MLTPIVAACADAAKAITVTAVRIESVFMTLLLFEWRTLSDGAAERRTRRTNRLLSCRIEVLVASIFDPFLGNSLPEPGTPWLAALRVRHVSMGPPLQNRGYD
jgi:hypothetical protein